MLYVDLHHHSNYSDGALGIEQVYRIHADAGWLVVLTDHDTADGQRALLKFQDLSDKQVTFYDTYALEKTSCAHVLLDDGSLAKIHFNVYCPFYFQANEVPCELHEAVEWAEKNGCLVQLNHPSLRNFWRAPDIVRSAVDAGVHMIEICNGHDFWFMTLRNVYSVLSLYGRWEAVKRVLEFGFDYQALAYVAFSLISPVAQVTSNSDSHFAGTSLRNGNLLMVRCSELDWNCFEGAVRSRGLLPARFERFPLRYRTAQIVRYLYGKGLIPRFLGSAVLKLFGLGRKADMILDSAKWYKTHQV